MLFRGVARICRSPLFTDAESLHQCFQPTSVLYCSSVGSSALPSAFRGTPPSHLLVIQHVEGFAAKVMLQLRQASQVLIESSESLKALERPPAHVVVCPELVHVERLPQLKVCRGRSITRQIQGAMLLEPDVELAVMCAYRVL